MPRGKKRNVDVALEGKYVPCFSSQRQTKKRKEEIEQGDENMSKSASQTDAAHHSGNVENSPSSITQVTSPSTQVICPAVGTGMGKQPGCNKPQEQAVETALPENMHSCGLLISTWPQLSRSPSASLTTPGQLQKHSPGNSQLSHTSSDVVATPPATVASPFHTTDIPVSIKTCSGSQEEVNKSEKFETKEVEQVFIANCPEEQAQENAISSMSEASMLLDQAACTLPALNFNAPTDDVPKLTVTPTDSRPSHAGSVMVQGITSELAKLNATVLKAKRDLEAISRLCPRSNYKASRRRQQLYAAVDNFSHH